MKNDKTPPLSDKMPLVVDRAYSYYMKGLTAKETAILCKISVRTVQRWTKEYDFKKMAVPMPLPDRCFALSKQGFSYTEIARQLKISKSSVYNHIRKYREHQQDAGSK